MNWLFLPLLIVAATLFALGLWSRHDARAVDAAWQRLILSAPREPVRFDPSMIADLPEPARRFLGAAIRPGTPLATVAEVSMRGELSLGTKAKHEYWPMRACQILAAPHGFAWQVASGKPPLRMRGSDGAVPGDSWTRFWMAGVIPVARVGGTADHARSSFARFVSEASFWTPAVMMPSDSVHWEAIDADTARVTLTYGEHAQAIDLTLDAEGHPVRVAFDRWSDANTHKRFRLQRFGGELSEFREFDGFTVPTRIEAGNHYGTDEYFPFFKATVDEVRFIASPDDARGCAAP